VGPLSDELDFDAEAFLTLPVKDRVKLCRVMAGRANALAARASPKFRGHYAEIAKQWQILADEMEQSAKSSAKD